MRKDKKQAVVLRQAGMTYVEIKNQMGVPRSTLSEWFRGQNWSNDIATENARKARNSGGIRLVVLNTMRATRLKKIYEDASQDAYLDFQELKYHPLFMSGIFLYWSHGDRTSPHRVSLGSMDVRVIKIFYMFLRDVCGVRNIRTQLLLGTGFEREEEIKRHWMTECGLQAGNFIKSVAIKSKKPTNKPYNGVCNLIVNSAYLKNKILKWIELLIEDISTEKYNKALEDNAGIV